MCQNGPLVSLNNTCLGLAPPDLCGLRLSLEKQEHPTELWWSWDVLVMVERHSDDGKVWWWDTLLVVGRSGGWMLSWWWDILVAGHSHGGGKLWGGGCFRGGHHVAQRLCPDNILLLAWGQMGINFPVASFLLPRLVECLGFPGDANVRNLRTCRNMVSLPLCCCACPCCLLGESCSVRTAEIEPSGLDAHPRAPRLPSTLIVFAGS